MKKFQPVPRCTQCGVSRDLIAMMARVHNTAQMTLWQRLKTWLYKPICRGIKERHMHFICCVCGYEWITGPCPTTKEKPIIHDPLPPEPELFVPGPTWHPKLEGDMTKAEKMSYGATSSCARCGGQGIAWVDDLKVWCPDCGPEDVAGRPWEPADLPQNPLPGIPYPTAPELPSNEQVRK